MTIFVRAVIMLVTLVGLPTAWIYYGPLPPGPQKVVDRFMEVARDALGWRQNPTRETAEPPGSAPRFGSQGQLRQAPGFDAVDIPSPLPSVSESQRGNRANGSGISPSAVSSSPVTLASAQTPAAENTIANPLPSPTPDDLEEQLRPHLTLLRSLGAADYKLEKWGSAGRQYRFCCSIALGDDPALARNFQAIDTDPVAAVRQIVGEVTAWQNARLAPSESITRLR